MIAALDLVSYTYSENMEIRSFFKEWQTSDISKEFLTFGLHAV
jgi:hypothetical protein